MADKKRYASLSMEENERLPEAVLQFSCFYDKSKLEYKLQKCSPKCMEASR